MDAPRVSVLVPARNEEASLGRCLRSLVAQQGIDFELIVIDDASTDGTRHLARAITGEVMSTVGKRLGQRGIRRMLVLSSRAPLPAGWTGKANALCSGMDHARGEWLLFTDADTEHAPGSLAAAVTEAEEHGAALLSYSPEQEVEGFAERALMPVIFSELASRYRPSDVSDPTKDAAAANGQYLLIRRSVYEAVGGHAAIAADLLEDVALATRVKRAGYPLRFRLGRGMVRTRMYRGWEQMREGWTKNLALLFDDAPQLAAVRAAEFAVLLGLPVAAGCALANGKRGAGWGLLGAAAACWGMFGRRVRRAHFDSLSTALAVFGLPLFSRLLLDSVAAHRKGAVRWKGRSYGEHAAPQPASPRSPKAPAVEPEACFMGSLKGPGLSRAAHNEEE